MNQLSNGIVTLYLALVGYAPLAMAQTATMYPGSSINFYSEWIDANASNCPSGSNGGFLRVVAANGWKVEQTSLIRESKDGVASANYTNYSEYSVVTIHPDAKRMRHWFLKTEDHVERQGNLKIYTCRAYAILQGDRLDDYLVIDIGVLTAEKQQKGMSVSPITVTRPGYCDYDWPTQRKDSLVQETKAFDCAENGIPAVGTVQTQNLPK